MRISVIKRVTARTGASTGTDAITMLDPGFDADVEYLTGDGITSTGQELPNGDIWAKLVKQIKNQAGQLRTAYVAVRVSGTRYCNTVDAEPTLTSISDFDRGYNAGLTAAEQACAVTLRGLRK